jgi:four helix bundle protein
MSNENLKLRTKQFALRIIKMVGCFPEKTICKVIGNQVLRSATSIAANYRAACFAKSRSDFINKLKIVEEETDETIFWLELIEESEIFPRNKLHAIKSEGHEILAIIVSSIKTSRSKLKKTT